MTSAVTKPSFLKYLDPTGDPSFWKEVEEIWQHVSSTDNSDLNRVVNERRAQRVIKDFCSSTDDECWNPVLVMINDWYKEYHSNPVSKEYVDFQSFEREISLIAQTIISLEFSSLNDESNMCRKSQHYIVDKRSGITKTLLHAIVDSSKKNLFPLNQKSKMLAPIVECLLRYDPSLVYATTEGESWEKLPLELALLNFDDDMSTLLIESMEEKERVRSLFQYDYARKTAARFHFIDYIKRSDMQKTVMAILDSLIGPSVKIPIAYEMGVSCFSAKQYKYHFRILDGDLEGKCECSNGDGKANWFEMSCLQALCLSKFNKVIIEHPAIRLLARRKWETYGRFYVRLHLALYVAFLILMSFSLIGHLYSTKYKGGVGVSILSCDIMIVVFCITYLGIETDQFRREKFHYLFDVYNYIDIFGTIFLMLTIFLRWASIDNPELASCAFLLNYFRLFKFLSAFRSSGVYLATLSNLIKKNLPVFIAVYSILLTAFSGACFISLNGNPRLSLHEITLRGIRSFTEGQAFAENYTDFSAFSTIIILGGTLVSSLILANVLIAQLSESYAVSKSNAALHYDIAKLKFVTRMENSRFNFMNLRLKYYEESTVSSEEELLALQKETYN